MAENDIVRIHPTSSETHLAAVSLASGNLPALALHAIGHGIERQDYEIFRKRRQGHQVIYTLGGRGWFSVDGKRQVVQSGDIWVTAHGQTQHYGMVGSSWEILWFVFEPRSPWWSGQNGCPGPQPPNYAEPLKHAVLGLYRETNAKKPGSIELCQSYAQEINILLERDLQPLRDETAHSIQQHKLNAMIQQIREDLARDWTVALLLETSQLHVCPDHFSRLCKSHLGKRPLQLVTDLRMQKAAELLICSDYKLELLSSLLGYGSPFALSVAFKRHCGFSPQQYRARQTNATHNATAVRLRHP